VDSLADSEFPSPRADVAIGRERTGIHVKGSAPGGFAAELDVDTDGSGRSPAAKAVTMLILVAAACVATATFAVICWLVHAPALLLVLAVLAVFAGVLITGTMIAFRPGRQPPPATGPGPAIIHRPDARDKGNGSALHRRGHKAIQNGNGTKKARAASRNRQDKPSRR
jgi:hypothetical protein